MRIPIAAGAHEIRIICRSVAARKCFTTRLYTSGRRKQSCSTEACLAQAL